MEWSDEAVVISVRPFGEHSAILEALTRGHGRHLGLLRSANSKQMRGMLEAGNNLTVLWRARLDHQLGNFSIELSSARAAHFFEDGLKLAALSSACALCSATLPEREAHERVFAALDGLLQLMTLVQSPDWVASYVRFEMVLLEDLGFGLDLGSCAVTGAREGLGFVSPKSGRAVTKEGAGGYAHRLLVLPAFLAGASPHADLADLTAGLALTEHFLTRVLREAHRIELPQARRRFGERLSHRG
ncbi:MAG: DNA repair protein RecO [Micropepsaceae bacterium]